MNHICITMDHFLNARNKGSILQLDFICQGSGKLIVIHATEGSTGAALGFSRAYSRKFIFYIELVSQGDISCGCAFGKPL